MTPDNTWHLFPVQLLRKNKHEVQRNLKERFGVETDHYYPVLTHQQETPLKHTMFARTHLPRTEEVHSRLIHLPLHNNLTIGEQERVIEGLHGTLA